MLTLESNAIPPRYLQIPTLFESGRPGLLGAARSFSLFPNRRPQLPVAIDDILAVSDEQAIREDWEMVGKDLTHAIAKYGGLASSQPESTD